MEMRKITQDELDKIIDEHQKWTRGLRRQRANLSHCDISGLNMSYANLANGIFVNADMSSVDLTCTNLTNAEMSGAILTRADLTHTNLSSTNLSGADLSEAILPGALFYRSILSFCKFKDNTGLQNAFFKNVDLSKICSNGFSLPMACPDTGAFIGWKKCRDRCGDPVIVKLLIPEDAKRSSAAGRKCRCNKVIVLDIEGADVAYSRYDISFVYKVGETIQVDNFEENRFIECAPGIHFFINKQEAIEYSG